MFCSRFRSVHSLHECDGAHTHGLRRLIRGKRTDKYWWQTSRPHHSRRRNIPARAGSRLDGDDRRRDPCPGLRKDHASEPAPSRSRLHRPSSRRGRARVRRWPTILTEPWPKRPVAGDRCRETPRAWTSSLPPQGPVPVVEPKSSGLHGNEEECKGSPPHCQTWPTQGGEEECGTGAN